MHVELLPRLNYHIHKSLFTESLVQQKIYGIASYRQLRPHIRAVGGHAGKQRCKYKQSAVENFVDKYCPLLIFIIIFAKNSC